MLRDASLIPLSHQHHNGLALCVLTKRELQQSTTEKNVRKLAQRVVDRYEIELVNHFALEEAILFPAFEKHNGASDLVCRLLLEKKKLHVLVSEFRYSQSI